MQTLLHRRCPTISHRRKLHSAPPSLWRSRRGLGYLPPSSPAPTPTSATNWSWIFIIHHHHHLFWKRPFFHAKLGLDVCPKSSPSTYSPLRNYTVSYFNKCQPRRPNFFREDDDDSMIRHGCKGVEFTSSRDWWNWHDPCIHRQTVISSTTSATSRTTWKQIDQWLFDQIGATTKLNQIYKYMWTLRALSPIFIKCQWMTIVDYVSNYGIYHKFYRNCKFQNNYWVEQN